MLREVNEHLKPLPLASIFSSTWSQALSWDKKDLTILMDTCSMTVAFVALNPKQEDNQIEELFPRKHIK